MRSEDRTWIVATVSRGLRAAGAVAFAWAVFSGCRAKSGNASRNGEALAVHATAADARPAAEDAPEEAPVTKAEAPDARSSDDTVDASRSDVPGAEGPVEEDAGRPEAFATGSAAEPDIGDGEPCDPDLPAELMAMRNREDRELRLAHARYASGDDGEEDVCIPGADCPRPIDDLNGDGRPEYVVEIGYCDSSAWWLAASTPRGYEKAIVDGEGRTELLTPRLPDGRRVAVRVHDCCCQSHVVVSQVGPDGDVEDLYAWVSDCGACNAWVEAQVEAGAVPVGTGVYQALPEIEDGVLRGIREPEDCSGTRYRLVPAPSFAREAGGAS